MYVYTYIYHTNLYNWSCSVMLDWPCPRSNSKTSTAPFLPKSQTYVELSTFLVCHQTFGLQRFAGEGSHLLQVLPGGLVMAVWKSLTMIIKLEVVSPSTARNWECWNHYLALHLTIDSSFHLLNVVSGWIHHISPTHCVWACVVPPLKMVKKNISNLGKLYPNAPVNTYHGQSTYPRVRYPHDS